MSYSDLRNTININKPSHGWSKNTSNWSDVDSWVNSTLSFFRLPKHCWSSSNSDRSCCHWVETSCPASAKNRLNVGDSRAMPIKQCEIWLYRVRPPNDSKFTYAVSDRLRMHDGKFMHKLVNSRCYRNSTVLPIGSMYAVYGNIYHQYTPNVSIYTIHGSYG